MLKRTWVVVFPLWLTCLKGEPLEVSIARGLNDLTPRGVDLKGCHRLVYQAKGCKDHGISLLDGSGAELVQFLIGGWYNVQSKVTVKPTGAAKFASSRNIVDCAEFRWFWMSWGEGRIQYGKGMNIGQNKLFDLEDTTANDVKKLAQQGYNGILSTIRLGEKGKGRFERVLQQGKFVDGLIEEISTSRNNCASTCSDHPDCGMFSHNGALGLCKIYNRMTSSLTMTSESGWVSWKLMYCYP